MSQQAACLNTSVAVGTSTFVVLHASFASRTLERGFSDSFGELTGTIGPFSHKFWRSYITLHDPSFFPHFLGFSMSTRVLLLLLVPLVAADLESWCQVKHGKCTGQRHSFKPREELKLWERVIGFQSLLHLKSARLADWDLDGDLDIIVAENENWDPKKWQLWVLQQLANGSFMPHPLAKVELDNFAVADWDANGQMDVLVCHTKNEAVIVSRLAHSPTSSPEVILNTSGDPSM